MMPCILRKQKEERNRGDRLQVERNKRVYFSLFFYMYISRVPACCAGSLSFPVITDDLFT